MRLSCSLTLHFSLPAPFTNPLHKPVTPLSQSLREAPRIHARRTPRRHRRHCNPRRASASHPLQRERISPPRLVRLEPPPDYFGHTDLRRRTRRYFPGTTGWRRRAGASGGRRRHELLRFADALRPQPKTLVLSLHRRRTRQHYVLSHERPHRDLQWFAHGRDLRPGQHPPPRRIRPYPLGPRDAAP